MRDSIHRLKYRGEHARVRFHARLLADRLMSIGFDRAGWDGIAGVPLHPQRRRIRGYDQGELLALALAESFDLPVLPGLRRCRDTPSQVGLDHLARRQNVRGAFDWMSRPLEGERVILIDDVVTTGSTLSAVAEALYSAGAGRVLAVALARES